VIPTNRRGRNPWFVAALTVLSIGVVFFVGRHAAGAWRLVHEAGSLDPRLAAVGVALSGVAVANRGLLNRAAHSAVGLDAGVGAMTRTAAVGFAAQKMVKSAGAAGLAVFVHDGRRRGHAPGAVAAACVLTAVASFVALGILLVSAIVLLAVTDRLSGWWVVAGAGFGLYAMGATVAASLVMRNRDAAVRIWARAERRWWRLRRRPRPASSVASVPNHLFEALDTARASAGSVGLLLLHGVVSKALGALMLLAAVAAVGLPVSLTGAVIVYATALGASVVTIVPGGVGVVEGSTAALLVASGAPVASAALAVIVFRCFDLLVPVIVGVAATRGRFKSEPETQPEPVEAAPTALGLVAAA
jgi:uncharacterized protein (TIRG00374 family)